MTNEPTAPKLRADLIWLLERTCSGPRCPENFHRRPLHPRPRYRSHRPQGHQCYRLPSSLSRATASRTVTTAVCGHRLLEVSDVYTAPPAGATQYGYDDAGNLASASDGLSASYNQLSQATQITPPGGQPFEMEYGDLTQDRRTRAGDQRLAYNQLGLSSQGPNSGVPHASWFVRDPSGTLVAMVDRNANEKDLYYLFDGLGSVAATVRNDQTVDRRYTYDPYGEQTTPDPATDTTDINPWRYTSGYYDQTTGMLKLGTRYYMPNLARWTQPDPIPGKPWRPHDPQPPRLRRRHPTNTTDPSGRSGCPTGG